MSTTEQKIRLLQDLLDRVGRRRRGVDGSMPPAGAGAAGALETEAAAAKEESAAMQEDVVYISEEFEVKAEPPATLPEPITPYFRLRPRGPEDEEETIQVKQQFLEEARRPGPAAPKAHAVAEEPAAEASRPVTAEGTEAQAAPEIPPVAPELKPAADAEDFESFPEVEEEEEEEEAAFIGSPPGVKAPAPPPAVEDWPLSIEEEEAQVPMAEEAAAPAAAPAAAGAAVEPVGVRLFHEPLVERPAEMTKEARLAEAPTALPPEPIAIVTEMKATPPAAPAAAAAIPVPPELTGPEKIEAAPLPIEAKPFLFEGAAARSRPRTIGTILRRALRVGEKQ